MTTVEELIENHISIAKTIARSHKIKFHHISIDELEAAALYGLVHAANKFDELRGIPFINFASKRIYGAIVDYVNELLSGPKGNKRPPEQLPEDEQGVEDKAGEMHFEELICFLPTRTQYIMRRVYVFDDSLADISSVLKIGESRISQIVTKARKSIQDRFGKLYSSVA